MAAAYLEINKLPCFHEIDIIPKYIKLGVIGFFVLCGQLSKLCPVTPTSIQDGCGQRT
jgi:hypothetical protein